MLRVGRVEELLRRYLGDGVEKRLLLADCIGPLARRVWPKVETFRNKQVAGRIVYYKKEVSFPLPRQLETDKPQHYFE